MEFSIVYIGRIPSTGSGSDKQVIREDLYLQDQLFALRNVLEKRDFYKDDTIKSRLKIDGAEYNAVIPANWVCKIHIQLFRNFENLHIEQISDVDNVFKTLFDGITAPSVKGTTTPSKDKLYCLAIDDKQFNLEKVTQSHHWGNDKDIAIINVVTKETIFDECVHLGGLSFEKAGYYKELY